jgi:hypothetical protein
LEDLLFIIRSIEPQWKHYPPLCHPDPDFLPRCAGQGRVRAFL